MTISTALDVGVAGNGDLNVLDASAVRAVDVTIGKGSAGQGSVRVEGADSRLVASGELVIGSLGPASLSATAGGIVEAGSLSVGSGPAVSGFLSFDGTETGVVVTVAGDATLGAFGVASLTGSGSTKLSIGGDFTLGAFADATATAFFFGGEGDDVLKLSTITVNDALTIGGAGEASVVLSGSSVVEIGTMRLGGASGGSGSYSVSGALNFTKIFGELLVADSGSGQVSARNGASIRTSACVLGNAPGGLGALRLESGAALRVEQIIREESTEGESEPLEKEELSVGFLEVGKHSNGLVELFDAETKISCFGLLIGGDTPAAGGTLNIDSGARLAASDSMALGNKAGPGLVRVASAGILSIAGVIVVGPNGLFIAGPNAQLSCTDFFVFGRLEIVETLTITRPAVEDKGRAPQPSAKAAPLPAIIQGNLKLDPAATLSVAVAEGTALQITGTAELAGTLELVLEPGEVLADDQRVNLIDFAGDTSGAFGRVTFVNAPSDFVGEVEFDGTTLRLRVIRGGTTGGEGEGEGETPMDGCGGCFDTSDPLSKQLGDALAMLAGLSILLVSRRMYS